MNIKGLLISLAVVAPATSLAVQPTDFQITYSADARTCQSFQKMLSVFDRCLIDDDCFTSTWGDAESLGLTRISFKQVAVNQYGYTQVEVAKTSSKSYSLVYLERFQGDRNPRLVETWKIDTAALDSLMAQNPHPLAYGFEGMRRRLGIRWVLSVRLSHQGNCQAPIGWSQGNADM